MKQDQDDFNWIELRANYVDDFPTFMFRKGESLVKKEHFLKLLNPQFHTEFSSLFVQKIIGFWFQKKSRLASFFVYMQEREKKAF